MRLHFNGLWRHPDFMRLWTGQTISVFGSMIGGTAMSFTAILFLNATPFQLGILASARLAPSLIMALVAGAWVDRVRRRPLLITADLGRAALLATIPAAAFLHLLSVEHLYVVAFAVSLFTIFFDVAYQAYLPSLLRREELLEGNSKLSASAAVAEVGGFSIAGWLVQMFSAPTTMLIDAISFGMSALAISRIRSPEPMPAPEPQPHLVREIGEGLRTVIHDPFLAALALSNLIRSLSGGIYGALVVLYMSRGLGFQPGVLTMIWAVGGVSSLIGALTATTTTRRLGVGRTMVIGLTVAGLASLFIPLAVGATLSAALLLIGAQLLGDGAFTLFEINQVSLRQSIAPERLLGRVNASMQVIDVGATLVGSLLGGVLGELIGVRSALVIGGCGTLLAALLLALSPVRHLPVAGAKSTHAP